MTPAELRIPLKDFVENELRRLPADHPLARVLRALPTSVTPSELRALIPTFDALLS